MRKLSLISQLRRLVSSSPRLLLDSLRLFLPTAIFFIKFLEWWYSPTSPARSLNTSPLGPAIPPPQMLPPHPQGIKVDRQGYGMCPLCRKQITNATALPSGYVFCYRCAHDYVEKQGKCPATLLPTRTWQLRKVLVWPCSGRLLDARSLEYTPYLCITFVFCRLSDEIIQGSFTLVYERKNSEDIISVSITIDTRDQEVIDSIHVYCQRLEVENFNINVYDSTRFATRSSVILICTPASIY